MDKRPITHKLSIPLNGKNKDPQTIQYSNLVTEPQTDFIQTKIAETKTVHTHSILDWL